MSRDRNRAAAVCRTAAAEARLLLEPALALNKLDRSIYDKSNFKTKKFELNQSLNEMLDFTFNKCHLIEMDSARKLNDPVY